MAVYHVVALAFQESVSAEDQGKAHEQLLDLKNQCKKPNGEKYIVELTGATKNQSTEEMGKNFTNVYVIKFASMADRDYYVNEDKAHTSFKTAALPMASDAFIYDYEM